MFCKDHYYNTIIILKKSIYFYTLITVIFTFAQSSDRRSQELIAKLEELTEASLSKCAAWCPVISRST